MDWIDYKNYFGPDRRRGRTKRLLDRRREEVGGPPPALRTALRQLRMRILDTQTPAGAQTFIERVQATVALATMHGESRAADMLSRMAIHLMRANGADVSQQLHVALDKILDAVVGND